MIQNNCVTHVYSSCVYWRFIAIYTAWREIKIRGIHFQFSVLNLFLQYCIFVLATPGALLWQ